MSAVREGHYARKQLFTQSWLINWSHGARFQMGVSLARKYAGASLLDYGSGDGTFVSMLVADLSRPATAVGAELHQEIVEDSRRRHLNSRLRFIRIDELSENIYASAFDTLVCMEVLEHVVERQAVFDLWRRLLTPGGRLIISVPVETGPVLVGKQILRQIAGWRGIGDYPGMSPYTWPEFYQSLFAGRRQHMQRPVHTDASGFNSHCHKGFNWRLLREELKAHFDLVTSLSSPLQWLPTGWGSQAWFVLRNRP